MKTRKLKRTLWRLMVLSFVAAFLASGLLRIWGGGRAYATDRQSIELETIDESALPEMNILIKQLSERENRIKQREAELKNFENSMIEMRKKIEIQISALETAEQKLADRMASSNTASEEDLTLLTSVYEAMKPKVAAGLFASMDPEFAAEFLIRMDPEGTAAVFSNLPSDTAYALSVAMAGRNALAAKEDVE